MAEWTIELKIRPCIVKNYHQPGFIGEVTAWFHCWAAIDGETLALVEFENGNVRFVKPRRIRFLDTKRVGDEYDLSHIYPEKECEIRGE